MHRLVPSLGAILAFGLANQVSEKPAKQVSEKKAMCSYPVGDLAQEVVIELLKQPDGPPLSFDFRLAFEIT